MAAFGASPSARSRSTPAPTPRAEGAVARAAGHPARGERRSAATRDRDPPGGDTRSSSRSSVCSGSDSMRPTRRARWPHGRARRPWRVRRSDRQRPDPARVTPPQNAPSGSRSGTRRKVARLLPPAPEHPTGSWSRTRGGGGGSRRPRPPSPGCLPRRWAQPWFSPSVGSIEAPVSSRDLRSLSTHAQPPPAPRLPCRRTSARSASAPRPARGSPSTSRPRPGPRRSRT